MSELYEKVEKFVENNCADRLEHLQRTAFWVKEMKPDADEALLIAAVGHDIYRPDGKGKSFLDKDIMREHQEGSARMIGDLLEKEGANEQIISRVKTLTSKHEVGGDDDQNLLKDADSISFLETKIDKFTGEKLKEVSREKVREKFDYTYERITSENAKEIAKPMYKEAIRRLEAV